MKSFTKMMMTLAMVLCLVVPAMALDESACDKFPHNWADNIQCEGLLDADEVAALDPTDFAGRNFSPVTNDFGLWPASTVGGVVVEDYRLDNRRFPDGVTIDSKFQVHGTKGALTIPKIWKMTVNAPQDTDCGDGDCDWMLPTDQNGNPTLPYPAVVYHTDFEESSYVDVGFSDPWIPDGCEADGSWTDTGIYPGQPDCVQLPPFCNADGSPNFDLCVNQGDPNPNNLPDCLCTPDYSFCPDCTTQPTCTAFTDWEDPNKCGYYLPTMRSVGGSPILVEDIVNVTSPLGVALPWYKSNEVASIRKYSTDNNQLPDEYGANHTLDDSIYFYPFAVPHPVGVYTFTLNLVGGDTIDLPVTVESNEVMPTVKATTSYTDIVATKVNKSGKITKATETTVTVPNITAREIEDRNGNIRLLIQWAEPDGAMTLVNDTRLRIFIGNEWENGPAVKNQSFLFLDVPVQSGSVVVPSEPYLWIKDEMVNNGKTSLDISGMYREQFSYDDDRASFHNRGFMEKIEFTFTP